jgi:WD40 repeat protein
MDSSREEKKYKDKNKPKKKDKLSRRSSRASISRQGWTLWISYKNSDSIPVEVDPSFTVHDVKAVVQRCDEYDFESVKLSRIRLLAGGKLLQPKSLVMDILKDGDELEVSITESNQLFSTSSSNLLTLGNSGNNTNNTQSNSLNGSTSPGSNSPNISINGSDQHPGINIANGPSDNDTKSIVPNKSSPNTPRIKNSSINAAEDIDTSAITSVAQIGEMLRNTLKTITKRMEQMEAKIEYKNNNFDLAMKELRILIASIKSRPAEPVNAENLNSNILKQKFTLHGHQGPVWSLAHHEGILYSGSSDQTIQVWDMSTGKHRHTINGHENIVRSVVATSNKLISASDDKTIKVWDTDNFRCTKTINMNKIACELKIATGYLFAGSYKCVKIWNLDTLEPEKDLEGHNHWVRAVRVANGYLFCGGHNLVTMWDMGNYKCVKTLETSCGSIYSLLQSGHLLLSGTYENTINVWDTRTWECVRSLSGHTGAVYSLAINGNKLYSGSYDNTIRIWDLTSFQCLQKVQAHTNSVESLVTDGEHICSGSTDSSIKIWRDNRV